MDYAITLHIRLKIGQHTKGLLSAHMELRFIIQSYTGDFDKLKLKIKKGIKEETSSVDEENWIQTYSSTLSDKISLEEIADQTDMTFEEKKPCFVLSKSQQWILKRSNNNGDEERTPKPILYNSLTKETKTAIVQTVKLIEQSNSSATFYSPIRMDMIKMLVESEEEFDRLCKPLSLPKEADKNLLNIFRERHSFAEGDTVSGEDSFQFGK